MKNKVKRESQIRKERQKGITLIALVVTIIVLIILAVISINLVFNEGGIISKSERARDFQVNAEASDREALDALAEEVDKYVPQKPVKVTLGEITEKNGTINGEAANWNNPIVPEGYKAINTGTSNWGDGSSNPTEANVNKGLVIEDRDKNQWVWVPVKDVSVMCDTANATEYTLCGTSGDTAVKTKLYSKSGIISGITRTTPGTTASPSWREPDLVVGNGTQYDAEDTNYKTILGENGTKEQLAQLFVDEYKEMITSVGTYGGFYIGRYELTANGEKPGATLTETTWYNLYNKCKEFEASDKVKSRMIWGCQWDVTCKWLAETKFASDPSKVYSNSSSWGNYKDSTDNAKVVENGENKYGTKQNTGCSEYWKANNIYDFAGNCYEWTQEASSNYVRGIRGGAYGYNGSERPGSERKISITTDNISDLRFSLHVNSSRDS